MACFVSNDLPLSGRLDDNVGASNSLTGITAVALGARRARLSEPSKANRRSSVAGGKQGPVGVGVLLLASPG